MGLPRCQLKNKENIKSLSERIKGKEGRVRGNLMGKRVEQSGRTVIGPDIVSINELRVPLPMAMNLTYSEIVNDKNREYLTALVRNGPFVYPGANAVILIRVDQNGREIETVRYLARNTRPIILKNGYKVERHLIDGDIVLFNRQPSLHKMSMMGHRIRIIPTMSILTFGMSVSVTEPYNADFDGDEMNIHVPQSPQTRTEMFLIADASLNCISPATSEMTIRAKQDTLMGIYEQTMPRSTINYRDAMNLLIKTSQGLDFDIPKGTVLSGRYVCSQIIKKTISSNMKDVNIVNGMIRSGIFDKSAIKRLLLILWFNYGSRDTTEFIDNLQIMVLKFLLITGYTVGIKDIVLSNEANQKLYDIIETKRKEVMHLITEYENDPSTISKEAFEAFIKESLKGIQGDIQKVVMANMNRLGGVFKCITSESAGEPMNAGQIMGCIGQVIVEAERIFKKYGGRTLPMFFKHDDSPAARGFCTGSFFRGLNPAEFVYTAMAGREGTINTAIKTAETGYLQRKLTKSLEDIMVEYGLTVRNANDKIIQYVYGGNGINVERQIEQTIGLVTSDNTEIRHKYVYTEEELKMMHRKKQANVKYSLELNEKLYHKLVVMRNNIREIQKSTNLSPVTLRDTFMMPVNLQQKIANIINQEDRRVSADEIVDPYEVYKRITYLYSENCSKLLAYRENENNQGALNIKRHDEAKVKTLLKLYLYDTLAPKRCTDEYKLTTQDLDNITHYFCNMFKLARIEGGVMVGMLAAQSMGEPITQTNLKSFQKAGTGKTVSSGLPRVKEIIEFRRDIKTPSMRIVINDQYNTDKSAVGMIASYLKYTTFSDVVEKIDIIYDPDFKYMQKDGVDNVYEAHKNTGCTTNYERLPWIIRIILSKEKLIDRNITMLEIKTSFCSNWSRRYEESKTSLKEYKKIIDKITQCAVISNYDNSEIPIIHIRYDANAYNYSTMIQFQEMILTKYRIKGIEGINESNNIVEESYVSYDKETGKHAVKKRFVIVTEGVNLKDIMQINGINHAESTCNDIYKVYEKYGVEAARALYIKELTRAIESTGGRSNYQHIELLADTVTHMGGIIAVNRHGANKLDTDVFSRASFEQTPDQMIAAAVFNESDHIRSLSSRVMVGTMFNGGTGLFDVMLDHDVIKERLPEEEEINELSVAEEEIIHKPTIAEDLIRKKKSKSKK
jgi:DNA-directed RNA polymerase II subunit RPB1